jgi:hypothetical protein
LRPAPFFHDYVVLLLRGNPVIIEIPLVPPPVLTALEALSLDQKHELPLTLRVSKDSARGDHRHTP